MKRLILLTLALWSGFCFGQVTDASLSTQSTNTILHDNYKPNQADALFQNIIKSKMSRAFGMNTTGTNAYSASAGLTTYLSNSVYLVNFQNANTSTSTTLNVDALGIKSVTNADGSAVAVGQLTKYQWLVYDGTAFRLIQGLSGSSSSTFASDIVVQLCCGKTIGPYSNGQTIPSAGKTSEQVVNLLAREYINPTINSFSLVGGGNVEVGFTFTGSYSWAWSTTANSATISGVDIRDLTNSNIVQTNIANTGSYSHAVTTTQLNSRGATLVYQLTVHDVTKPQDITATSTQIAYYKAWYGPVSSTVSDNTTIRALAQNTFDTGPITITLATGNTQQEFDVALPPGITITKVIDATALGLDITSQYHQIVGTVNYTDAGGTTRAYNVYRCQLGAPYSVSHNHQITLSN